MSTAFETALPGRINVGRSPVSASSAAAIWPLLAAVANAAAFYVLRPNVGDLQAALARQSAASNGVGLTYWFQWFGGGTAPGNYSVATPWLSAVVGAALLGALATVAITALMPVALVGTRFATTGTWVATIAAGLNLWSGRIPFALGCAAGVLALLAVRRHQWPGALVAAVGTSFCSPVCGALLAFGLIGTVAFDRTHARLAMGTIATCAGTLLFVGVYFGTPGPQPYSVRDSVTAAVAAAVMLLARPPRAVRLVLLGTVAASIALTLVPNGMGSNFVRFPYVCLPAAVVATAGSRRLIAVLCVVPALFCSAQVTAGDLGRARAPAAATSYYGSLSRELGRIPDLANSRLEVVQDNQLHTAAYALVDQVALAGGYETQQQNAFNGLLRSPTELDAVTYKIWLDNLAVGYVAFDRKSVTQAPEYRLVRSARLPYLTPIWHDTRWILYRVKNPTRIVAAPERLVGATQSMLTIRVPCACTFPVRVRYSKFLVAGGARPGQVAQVADDGTGWTTVTASAPGRYVLHGRLAR